MLDTNFRDMNRLWKLPLLYNNICINKFNTEGWHNDKQDVNGVVLTGKNAHS